MINLILKYLSWEALKLGLKTLIFKTVVAPQINRITIWLKVYINDPETEGDEELEAAINKFAKYQAEKWLGKVIK